jgi:serine/threonine protein kinase
LKSRGGDVAAAADRLVDCAGWPVEQPADLLELIGHYAETAREPAAATLIDAVTTRLSDGLSLAPVELSGWLAEHHDDLEALVDCLTVRPPEHVRVVKRLSQRGVQKVVYVAEWSVGDVDRPVMLKRFIGADAANRLMPRELAPHPLSMQHPNVIETHLFFNDAEIAEPFLVERRLPLALSESWPPRGAIEAANLLHDISAALGFIHSRGLVHGDVKPDNIGFERGRYVLLDFGICRPISDFQKKSEPSGEYLVRSPELLAGKPNTPQSDVWALAATVFNAIAGRYPLAKRDEMPGRDDLDARNAFKQEVAGRAQRRWDELVNSEMRLLVPHPGLARVLGQALERDPGQRPAADQLLRLCRRELSSLVRAVSLPAGMPPTQRIEQLRRYLPGPDHLRQMPRAKMLDLQAELDELGELSLKADERKALETLQAHMSDALGVE